jgi:hypothetical protein
MKARQVCASTIKFVELLVEPPGSLDLFPAVDLLWRQAGNVLVMQGSEAGHDVIQIGNIVGYPLEGCKPRSPPPLTNGDHVSYDIVPLSLDCSPDDVCHADGLDEIREGIALAAGQHY